MGLSAAAVAAATCAGVTGGAGGTTATARNGVPQRDDSVGGSLKVDDLRQRFLRGGMIPRLHGEYNERLLAYIIFSRALHHHAG